MSSVLKVGVFIPYHKKLTKYLDAVIRCFNHWDRIEAIEFDFTNIKEEEARHQGCNIFNDCDYLFTVDADEFITRADQEELISRMERKKASGAYIKVADYVDIEYNSVYSFREHKPIVVVNPKKAEFWQGRCLRGIDKGVFCDDIILHHMGYTFDKETMEWKDKNYWDQKNPNDVSQVMSRETVQYKLPQEIREIL